MKKGILILLAVLSLTAKSQKLSDREREYLFQYERGVTSFFYYDKSEAFAYKSFKHSDYYSKTYKDTVHTFVVGEYKFEDTGGIISYSDEFISFKFAYTKDKKKQRRKVDLVMGETFTGEFILEDSEYDKIIVRVDELYWDGDFKKITDFILFKGNHVYVHAVTYGAKNKLLE